MYYKIGEKLTDSGFSDCIAGPEKYVVVLNPDSWEKHRDSFDMGIDMDLNVKEVFTTKAEINYDSLTGSFSIPDRASISENRHNFSFALDEKGIVLIDHDGLAAKMVKSIKNSKKWRMPSLERFLYDFLENIICNDLALLEKYETRLNQLEAEIVKGRQENVNLIVNDIRGELLDLGTHYEQLIDLGQELEENENEFFAKENLRYFHLFVERVSRLQNMVNSLKEYTVQVRDLHKSQLDVKQNRIMTLLTVITSIFMPLTLIVGWYGMNFKYMPELNSPIAYPLVFASSVSIVILALIFFKWKKWL